LRPLLAEDGEAVLVVAPQGAVALVAGAEQRLGDVEVALVVAGEPPGRPLGGQALELRPHQVHVAALLGAEPAHDGAAVAELVDEPDRLELAQRLAHRRAAHAETARQVFLAQARPQRDAARDDLDLQPVGQVVGAREGRCVRAHTLDRNTAGSRTSATCIPTVYVWIQTAMVAGTTAKE